MSNAPTIVPFLAATIEITAEEAFPRRTILRVADADGCAAELYMSPGHANALANVLIQACDLEDGDFVTVPLPKCLEEPGGAMWSDLSVPRAAIKPGGTFQGGLAYRILDVTAHAVRANAAPAGREGRAA